MKTTRMLNFVSVSSVILCCAIVAGLTTKSLGQVPSPTPDSRGVGVQSSGPSTSSNATQQAKEAKPELVLQTGYSNFFGATRLVFSPDGRLLATATFRSSSIKLWDTATGRELRNLSGGRQSGMSISPYVAFSGDSRLVAAAAGSNAVKVWDVASGREVQTLTAGDGGIASSIVGVYFIAFSSNDRIVTISDAVRVWDVTTGKELSSITSDALSGLALPVVRRSTESRWNPTRARDYRSGEPGFVPRPRERPRDAHDKASQTTRWKALNWHLLRTGTCSSPELSTNERNFGT